MSLADARNIGDVIACPNWHHSDYCEAEGCQNERERQHLDCEWCEGEKRVRVAELQNGCVVIEPLSAPPGAPQ